jgi:putative membrane protein
VVLALLSPLDEFADRSFSAHMVQHEMLMLVAAPLLVLGRPLATWMWALPRDARRACGRFSRHWTVARAWSEVTRPVNAWMLHAAALWIWHVPRLFSAALNDPWMHAFQHLSFLATALLFWYALLFREAAGHRDGAAAGYLFTTMIHTGALGVLLTFSPAPWYDAYSASTMPLGWTPLEDQQLGGLIMWVPGGMVYAAAALVFMGRLLNGRPSPLQR